MFETTPCGHDLCNCMVTTEMPDEKYCSDACLGAVDGGIESETCPCGHPPCDTP